MKYPMICLLVLLLVGAFPMSSRAQTDDRPIIMPENLAQLTPLARVGRGSALYLDWHPDGDIVAFGGGWGVWLLDERFNEVAHFTDVPRLQDLAWHPSGQVLATLHEDELRLWRISDDFSAMTLDRAFPVSRPIQWWGETLDRCLAWSGDGQVIAVGTAPPIDRIADREPTPDPLEKLEFYSSEGGLIEFSDAPLEREVDARCHYGTVSPDGELETYLRNGYLAGTYYMDVIVAPDRNAEPVGAFSKQRFLTHAMDWHPSGDYITLIDQYMLQNVTWPDLTQAEYKMFFNGPISRLQWSPNGETLLAGSNYTEAAYLWWPQQGDTTFDTIRVGWAGEGFPRGNLWWTSSGELMSCSSDYEYYGCTVRDPENGTTIRRVAQSKDRFNMTPESRYTSVWNDDHTRYALFDDETGHIVVAGFEGEPVSVIWNLDVGRYVVGDYIADGGAPLPEIQLAGTFKPLLHMYWLREVLYILVGEDYNDYTVHRWDSDTNTVVETEEPPFSQRPIRLESQEVTTAEGEWRLRWNLSILDPETRKVLSVFKDFPEPDALVCYGDGCGRVTSSVHPSRRFIALNARGGIQFWSLEDGSLLHTIATERDIASLVWDADGRQLTAGSMDGTVYIFGIG
jgi:WD40 repeat protein